MLLIEKNKIIKNTAGIVRRWSEKYADNNKFQNDLCGLCVISSVELHLKLKSKGIDSKICLAEDDLEGSHCFLLIDDKILDITASQFDTWNPKIVYRNKKKCHDEWYWSINRVFESAEELKEYQVESGWPHDQVAFQV